LGRHILGEACEEDEADEQSTESFPLEKITGDFSRRLRFGRVRELLLDWI